MNPEKPVFIIDDENFILQSMSAVLRSAGIDNIITCNDSREVITKITEQKPSIVLLDLTMPHISGDVLLPEIKKIYPDLPVLVITGVNELSTAVDCMKKGAADYLVKAIENSKLISAVDNALNISALKEENRLLKKGLLEGQDDIHPAFKSIITEDISMLSIFRYLTIISSTKQIVLVRGDTGTGKELIAEAIHNASGLRGKFVSINAAGLDDTMFSDTLFGHKKGAYSGADTNRPGLIEKAAGGTLFLDEIGDLPGSSQIKLLRLLEKGDYYPLGSDLQKRADCRIVAATNRNLEQIMEDGTFRKDLYFRLSPNEVRLPSLRERYEDIPLLIHHFNEKLSTELGIHAPDLTADFIGSICRMELSGNVRELISIINRNISGAIPVAAENIQKISEDTAGKVVFPEELPQLKQWANMLVDEALRRSNGNISSAAAMLGISQPALSKRLTARR